MCDDEHAQGRKEHSDFCFLCAPAVLRPDTLDRQQQRARKVLIRRGKDFITRIKAMRARSIEESAIAGDVFKAFCILREKPAYQPHLDCLGFLSWWTLPSIKFHLANVFINKQQEWLAAFRCMQRLRDSAMQTAGSTGDASSISTAARLCEKCIDIVTRGPFNPDEDNMDDVDDDADDTDMPLENSVMLASVEDGQAPASTRGRQGARSRRQRPKRYQQRGRVRHERSSPRPVVADEAQGRAYSRGQGAGVFAAPQTTGDTL